MEKSATTCGPWLPCMIEVLVHLRLSGDMCHQAPVQTSGFSLPLHSHGTYGLVYPKFSKPFPHTPTKTPPLPPSPKKRRRRNRPPAPTPSPKTSANPKPRPRRASSDLTPQPKSPPPPKKTPPTPPPPNTHPSAPQIKNNKTRPPETPARLASVLGAPAAAARFRGMGCSSRQQRSLASAEALSSGSAASASARALGSAASSGGRGSGGENRAVVETESTNLGYNKKGLAPKTNPPEKGGDSQKYHRSGWINPLIPQPCFY